MWNVSGLVWEVLLSAWVSAEAVLSVLYWPLKVLASYIRIRQHAVKFPTGERTWPLLGHVYLAFFLSGPKLVSRFLDIGSKNEAGVIWVGVLPFFYVWDPRDVERVLCNSKSQDKPHIYHITERVLGKGLITSSGKLWQRHHKIIAPTFHGKVLESFLPIFNNQVDVYIDQLGKNADGNAVDILHMTERLTVDIICEAAMGTNLNVQKDSANEYQKALLTAQECILQRGLTPWLHPYFLYTLSSLYRKEEAALRITRGVRDRVIEERKKSFHAGELTTNENGKKQRLAFLDHLLLSVQAGAQLSDQEIVDEVDTFMFAGADTSSHLISFALFELARHPDVQDKAVEELESLYDASLPTIDITPVDLSRMTYLEMVLKETLRLHPSVPFVIRRAGENIRLASSDLVIPAGAQVGAVMYLTHTCAEYFPDPEKFDPKRFSPEKSRDRHPFAFLPFSAGQRVCIGRRLAMLEAKIAVAKALWHYKFTPEPGFEPAVSWGVTMKSINGVRLRIQTRREN